jgi:MFS family permease
VKADSVAAQASGDLAERALMARRAVLTSALATTIEWYDFFLYGSAAALVFPRLFFPKSDPFVATLLSFSTFFVGFIARPIGAAVFGHYGDRIGRKSLLATCMLLMGAASVGIGLVPAYDSIGIWGAVLLTVGRLLQGLGVGGAWSGSVLMAGEWTPPDRRGFTTSFAQFGAPAGLVLANGALALVSWSLGQQALFAWGWRLPFLASVVLIALGLWVRAGVQESPVFARIQEHGLIASTPLVCVLREHWRSVALTTLLRSGQHIPFYIFSTYVLNYGTSVLGLPTNFMLGLVMLQSALSMVSVPLAGYLSDLYGRYRMIALGCLIMIAWPFAYFALLDSGRTALIVTAVLLALPLHDLQYGPQAEYIAEQFPGRVRYTGSALGYQLASVTAGGPAPLMAAWLYHRFHAGSAIAAYMSLAALLSLACAWALAPRTASAEEQ